MPGRAKQGEGVRCTRHADDCTRPKDIRKCREAICLYANKKNRAIPCNADKKKRPTGRLKRHAEARSLIRHKNPAMLSMKNKSGVGYLVVLSAVEIVMLQAGKVLAKVKGNSLFMLPWSTSMSREMEVCRCRGRGARLDIQCKLGTFYMCIGYCGMKSL